MSSIIRDYEYDIFISYRQKDNKYDGWVTEFVENLKRELEATFKEEISVYFDINPHDGLLETHDVDASLKEKLKCLVFIPVISRTYCDPKSFAWEHEFKAFIEQASQDHFGIKIKLPNGNVAGRVLPVQIHDLDSEDIKLCESVLGGVLRGIEFIYKELGVNKPLTAADDENKNLNKIKYRIQVNKTANAIKEIISGLQRKTILTVANKTRIKEAEEEVYSEHKIPIHKNRVNLTIAKLLSGFLITTIIVIAAILVYPKIFKGDTIESLRSSDGRISVAVMPFQNMTNDTIWNVWQDGIQNILISSLSNAQELKVRQVETTNNLIQSKGLTNYSALTPSIASAISKKLDANVLIYGNINQAGGMIRINAQLINSKTVEAIKSFKVDGKSGMILQIIDSLSLMVNNFLVVSKLEKELSVGYFKATTKSPEAFRYYIYGRKAFLGKDFSTARALFMHAIELDSNFVEAKMEIPFTFELQGLRKEAKECCLKMCESLKNYEKHNSMTNMERIITNFLHAYWFETPVEEIKYIKQWIDIDDSEELYFQLGNAYGKLEQHDKSIPLYEKYLEMYRKLNLRSPACWDYTNLANAYLKTLQYKKVEKLYTEAIRDFRMRLIYSSCTQFYHYLRGILLRQMNI